MRRWLPLVALASLGFVLPGLGDIPEPTGPWPPPPPKKIPTLPPKPIPRPSPNGYPSPPSRPLIPPKPPIMPPTKPPVNVRPPINIIRPIVIVGKPVVIAGVLVTGGTYIGAHIDGPFRSDGVSTATYVQNAGGWRPVLGELWNDFRTNGGKGWPWQRPRPPVVVGGGGAQRDVPLVRAAVRNDLAL
jgi:hypothetical protein